ncbi:MAG: ferrous iron transport protein B [Crocinitomicaceae bacterium]
MSESESIGNRIALIGNPNLGKTTLFNTLCGLRQKTGNYPGVTIDKKRGKFKIDDADYELIDLPGINSMFPKSADEELVVNYLKDVSADDYPDKLVVVVSALNLKRGLYLLDQIRDLNRPTVLAINLVAQAEKKGIHIDDERLAAELGIPVVKINAKKGDGLGELREKLAMGLETDPRPIHFIQEDDHEALQAYMRVHEIENPYAAFLQLLNEENGGEEKFAEKHEFKIRQWRSNEPILRYKYLRQLIERCVKVDKKNAVDITTRLDRVLVHRVWGYVIFATIMLLIFQAIFYVASYPMDWIDAGMSNLSSWTSESMSEGYFTDLIADGVIPGIGGVVIFIPQIAILFFFFALLEESGYMQRIVYLMDKFMQKFGMSGKSIVPMISGMACAVPAIMAARTIESKKERLITILITPLMTCSARIPVYIILIALIIPDDLYVGIFNAQGLLMMGMYFLGIFMTLIVAYVLKYVLKSDVKGYLIIDMPEYLRPDFKSVMINVWVNVRAFLWNAGRIIFATSIILFVLGTNGGERFSNADEIVAQEYPSLSADEQEAKVETVKLEYSYLGVMGRTIEPVIKPLGYDWKIGIAIISSLAAREVFVGTISTIYSISSDEEMTIRDRLKQEKRLDGSKSFGFATCISLLLFYAFALQCFSTVAVTYKETGSLKWTSIQFFYMLAIAYIAALIAFQLLK